MIGWDPWSKKRIIWVAYKGRGFKRHSLYCTKCRTFCLSILKYLLFEWEVQMALLQTIKISNMQEREIYWIQNAIFLIIFEHVNYEFMIFNRFCRNPVIKFFYITQKRLQDSWILTNFFFFTGLFCLANLFMKWFWKKKSMNATIIEMHEMKYDLRGNWR